MTKNDLPNSERRKVLGMTASIAVGSALVSLNRRAQAAPPAKASALKQGVFTLEIDDIKVYCEVRGAGPLMILQNGMWLDSFTDHFGKPFRDALAQYFTVLTFDPRGQGRTSAGKGPITYGRFAADTVRIMDVLGIDQANFIGHSDGGCIQLHLLLDFADRVRTSTLVGTPYNHEAYTERTRSLFTDWFKQMQQGKESSWFNRSNQGSQPNAAPWWQEAEKRYRAVSPNPEKFHAMRLKQRDCYAVEPNIGLRQLATIARPVLVIEAGRDEHIPPEQFRILTDSIPRAQRVKFPEMTHDLTPYLSAISKAANEFVAAVNS